MQAYSPGGPPQPPRPGSGGTYYSGQGTYGYPPPAPTPYYNNPNAPPPQPQWQRPPAEHQQQWQPPGQAPSGPFTNQAPSSTYNPGAYGPMPGAQNSPISPMHYQAANVAPQGDTSRWGVKYNQSQHYGQYAETKPPLPPRPSSASSQSQSFPTSQGQYSSLGPSIAPAIDDRPSWTQDPRYDTSRYSPSPALPPPPPPKLPEGYQQEPNQQQNWSQQPQYSQHPPTHQYDPHSQGHSEAYSGYEANQAYPPTTQSHGQQGSDYAMYDTNNQGVPHSVSPIEQGSSYQWSTNPDDPRPPYISPPAPSHANLADHSPMQSGNIASGTNMSQGYSQPASKNDYDSQGYQHPVSRPNSAFQGTSSPERPPTASALGYGGPSDWEHFSPGAEDSENVVNNDAVPSTEQDTNSKVAELPSHHSPLTSPKTHQSMTPEQHEDQGGSSAVAAAPQPLQFRQTTPSQTQLPTVPPKSDFDHVKPVSRVDSMASVSTRTDHQAERSGSIDGVIQAWSEAQTGKAPSTTAIGLTQTKPPILLDEPAPFESRGGQTAAEVAPKIETHFIDPYGDLEPEYKASLARFVTMLRKEAVAATDEEKYRIFKAFLNRETKLREILYSVETSNTEPVRVSIVDSKGSSKGQIVKGNDSAATESTTILGNAGPSEPENKPASLETLTAKPPTPPEQGKISVDTSLANVRSSDVDLTEPAEYSPGGRPLVSRPNYGNASQAKPSTPSIGQRSLSLITKPQVLDKVADKSTISPGANAPIVVDTSELFRSSSVPPVPPKDVNNNNLAALDTKRPVYTPFRYTEGPQRGSETLKFDRPGYQPYSDLRQASADSGRVMARATSRAVSKRRDTVTSPSTARRQHEDAFLGLIRENSSTDQNDENSTSTQPAELPQHRDENQKPAVTAQLEMVEALKALIPPTPFSNKVENSGILAARRKMGTPLDDFSFIHDTVLSWDNSFKPERARLEKERHQRQEESEHRIDALFNENEIGYSDIAKLEETFRNEETDKKLLEDRRELESFKSNVFAAVDGRLKDEIDQIELQFQDALKLLESGTAGESMLERQSESPHISQAMQVVLALFKKLEIRHMKRVEAIVERERRRRKIELALWYSLGDVAATKNLADEFEFDERRTLHKAAQEKDDRANKLMDSFDRAIIRGLGENQRLTENILAKTREIKDALAGGTFTPPEGLRGLLSAAEAVTEALSVNSEACLQNFDIADKLLNEADYDVSVANVRLENGDPQTLRKLEDEKRIEDAKLQDDLNERLGLVRKYSGDTKALIHDIFQILGNPPSEANSPEAATNASDEAQRQERLKKALEEAKRRNASKE